MRISDYQLRRYHLAQAVCRGDVEMCEEDLKSILADMVMLVSKALEPTPLQEPPIG
jgi:hypothetical protein